MQFALLFFSITYSAVNADHCDVGNVLVTVMEEGFHIANVLKLSKVSATTTKVIFNNSEIAEVCSDSLANLKYVDDLRFINAGLRRIKPGALNNLMEMRYFVSDSNSLDVIPDGLFHNLKNLEIISLSKNKINRIETGAFANLPKLQIVDLSENNLTDIPRWFNESPNILFLDLSSNNLNEIPEGIFENFDNLVLHVINLNNNQIKIIKPGALASFMYPVKINLSGNKIEVLPKDFFSNAKLSLVLNLSFNQIKTIESGALQNLNNIKELLLNNNQIESLPEDFLSNLISGTLLDLTHNPLKCISRSLMKKFKFVKMSDQPQICT